MQFLRRCFIVRNCPTELLIRIIIRDNNTDLFLIHFLTMLRRLNLNIRCRIRCCFVKLILLPLLHIVRVTSHDSLPLLRLKILKLLLDDLILFKDNLWLHYYSFLHQSTTYFLIFMFTRLNASTVFSGLILSVKLSLILVEIDVDFVFI